MGTPIEWKSRKEWAVDMRTPYYDKFEDLMSDDISDYATADEVETALEELRILWLYYGRLMKAEEDAAFELKIRRRTVNEVIADLRKGKFNNRIDEVLDAAGKYIPSYTMTLNGLRIILASYEAAKAAAELAVYREVAATPIDDVAWERELQRRRSIERAREQGPRIITA